MNHPQNYQTRAYVVAGQEIPQPVEPPAELGGGWSLTNTSFSKDEQGTFALWTWTRVLDQADEDGEYLVQDA